MFFNYYREHLFVLYQACIFTLFVVAVVFHELCSFEWVHASCSFSVHDAFHAFNVFVAF